MNTAILLLLVLACPLMMMAMMRGHGHGGGHVGHSGGRPGGHHHEAEPREASIDELRRRRDELDRLIVERAQDSEQELTPTGSHQ